MPQDIDDCRVSSHSSFMSSQNDNHSSQLPAPRNTSVKTNSLSNVNSNSDFTDVIADPENHMVPPT